MAINRTAYGVSIPDRWTAFEIERFLFFYGNTLAKDPHLHPSPAGGWVKSDMPYTGEGRFQHFKAMMQALHPKSFEWHDWSEKATRAFCENKRTAITGCGGSGKSTDAGAYAFYWYMVDPCESAVLIASTTVDQAKKRIWKNIRQYFTEFVRKVGTTGGLTLIGSPKPHIRAPDIKTPDGKKIADSSHGIFIVPVAKGEEQKAIDALKGFHPKRLLMIGDETDAISQAIVDVGLNQAIGTIEYQQIWLGNDPSMFNPLGKMMEPEKGHAVTLAHKEWTSTNGTKCLRFDAFDSPNLKGKVRYSGIINRENIDDEIKNKGENHPQVWIMLRGIHPPEGADDTVLSEALFMRNECSKGVVWKRSFQTLCLLDPAFGGDRCVFRTIDYGIENGTDKMRVLVGKPIELHIDASDTETPAEYQIARKAKAMCNGLGIKPADFYMDATGTGRGVRSVLMVEWSPNINYCEFGGWPSSMAVSDEDPKPAKEAYDRKVTELWYSFRVFVEAGMIRGLDAETAVEFCARKFDVWNKKIRVEKKEDMKARGAPSPDFADCLVIGIHALRERGINAVVTSAVKTEFVQDYARKAKEHDLDGWEGNYSPGMEDVAAFEYMN